MGDREGLVARIRQIRRVAVPPDRSGAAANAKPDQVVGLGVGRTFQLTRIFGRLTVLENMLVATQRKQGWLSGVLRIAGSAAERRRAMELLEFVSTSRRGESTPR